MRTRRQSRNLWPFSPRQSARQTTSARGGVAAHQLKRRVPASKRPTTAGTEYKGYSIRHMEDGSFVIPSIDPETQFEDLKQAKRFIDSEAKAGKNPRSFYYIGTNEFSTRDAAVKRAQQYANEEGGPVTVRVERESTSKYTRARTSALGYSVSSQLPGYEFQVMPKKNPKGQSAKGVARDALKFADATTDVIWKVTGGVPSEILHRVLGSKNPKYGIGDERGVPISLHDTQAGAFAEARSLAGAGQRVEVVWKAKGGYKSKWFGTKRNPKRGNPSDESADMYESFHGRPANREILVEEEVEEQETFATLGIVVSLKVRTLSGYDLTTGPEDAEQQDYDETAANPDSVFLGFE